MLPTWLQIALMVAVAYKPTKEVALALWPRVKPYASKVAGVLPKGAMRSAAIFAWGMAAGAALQIAIVYGVPTSWSNWHIPGLAPSKVSAVTYVYEKDNGTAPPGVLAGLSKLNAQGIIATTFEEDTTDGTGETPEQYKIAKEAATKQGLPSLVVQAGDKVIHVVVKPTTEEETLGAIK